MSESITVPDRVNMVDFFLDDRVREGRAEKTAIYYGEDQITYQQVIDASCQVTNLLREHGLRIEDRCQLLLLDTPEFAYAYFGIVRAGCVAVPTNTWLKAKDFAYYLEYARPRAVFVDSTLWAEFEQALPAARHRPVIFFLGRNYSAEEAFQMGMVNAAVDHAALEDTALEWAKEVNGKSPTAQRMLKFAFNLIDDGLVGQQVFAGEATRLAYRTDEAQEGRNAFLEKRDQDFSAFPWFY